MFSFIHSIDHQNLHIFKSTGTIVILARSHSFSNIISQQKIGFILLTNIFTTKNNNCRKIEVCCTYLPFIGVTHHNLATLFVIISYSHFCHIIWTLEKGTNLNPKIHLFPSTSAHLNCRHSHRLFLQESLMKIHDELYPKFKN